MSRRAGAPRSGIDGQAWGDEAGMNVQRFAAQGRDSGLAGLRVAAGGSDTVVRPGRARNRTKTGLDEKTKSPADSARKKAPPARKAPARGRYVDEYARPTI